MIQSRTIYFKNKADKKPDLSKIDEKSGTKSKWEGFLHCWLL